MHANMIYGLIVTSFQAMLKVFLVCAVGFIAAKYPKDAPLLNKSALQVVSKLSTYIFIPCLTMSSLGSSLTFDQLGKIGFIVFCSPLVTIISLLFMKLCSGLVDSTADASLLAAMHVAAGFPNTISLPIMIMQTLCEQDSINADYDHDATKCNDAVSGIIFMYGIGFHTTYWSYALHQLRKASILTENNPSQTRMDVIAETLKRIATTPAIIGVAMGIFIGLVTPIQDALFKGGTIFRSLGSAIRTLGMPVTAIQSIVIAGSLGILDTGSAQRWTLTQENRSQTTANSLTLFASRQVGREVELASYSRLKQDEPSSATQLDDSFTASGSKVSSTIVLKSDLDDGCDHVVNENSQHMIEFSSDVQEQPQLQKEHSSTPENDVIPSMRNIIILMTCRLILTPIVILTLVYFAIHHRILDSSMRLLPLLICVESGTSSAQVIVVSLNEMGDSKLASKLAYMYFYQYIASIASITLWTTIALLIIYGQNP